jgi:hypothetical protein
MDADRFDRFTKTIRLGITRRDALRVLGAGPLAGLLSRHLVEDGRAAHVDGQRWRGGHFFAGNARRPAMLLFDGLCAIPAFWSQPSLLEPLAYDRKPARVRRRESYPNVGVYKIGGSDPLVPEEEHDAWNHEHAWTTRLTERGYTVGTFAQPGLTLQDAYPAAREAFIDFLAKTRSLNPSHPPPVALIGQSRGGLLIRKLLAEQGGMGRVKWVITLHSPHQGTAVGRSTLESLVRQAGVGGEAGEVVSDMLRKQFGKQFCLGPGARELAPDSDVIEELAAAEGGRGQPGILYYTYGGVSPTYARTYSWIFDAMSAVPQTEVWWDGLVPKSKTYFVWTANPEELDFASPMLDEFPGFNEMRRGRGDGVVTDESARLPYSRHTTTQLNHFEVMWDRALQDQVASLFEDLPGFSQLDPAAQFRRIHDYAVKNGFVGGFPNFHTFDFRFGIIVIRKEAAVWESVPAETLARHFREPQHFTNRFVAVHRYAQSKGFVSGFPNFHELHGDYGVILLKRGFARYNNNVSAAAIGAPARVDTPEGVGAFFRALHDYAYSNDFASAFPSYENADYGQGRIYGATFMGSNAAQWRDVAGS